MYRIMLVDDMDIVRRKIKRLALWDTPIGFTITCEAENGKDALEMLGKGPVELVITDIRMPFVDGIELLKKIKEENLAPYVIFMSDYDDFRYAREGFRYGAFDYLVKPVREEELIEALKKVKGELDEMVKTQKRLKTLEEKLTIKSEQPIAPAQIKRVGDLILWASQDALQALKRLKAELAALGETVYGEPLDLRLMDSIENYLHAGHPWLAKYACNREKKSREILEDFVSSKLRIMKLFRLYEIKNETIKRIAVHILGCVEEDLSLASVARNFFINRSYLSESFKKETGITVGDYIYTAKMERAGVLLGENRLKNYEIADLLHFHDVEYFSRIFKKYWGHSPSGFRLGQVKSDISQG